MKHPLSRRPSITAVFALAVVGASGCTTEGKKDVAKSALHTMSTEDRRETFEATARILDEQPQLVDELYATVRRHPKTMHRFLQNTAPDLSDPALASDMGELLSHEPASIEQTLISATDAIAKEPKARMAMDRALAKRAEKTVDILTDDPNALSRLVGAAFVVLEKKPRARENVASAVSKNREKIIAFVKSDPELAKALTEELLKEAVKDKPTLDKLLRAAGVVDDVPAKEKAKRSAPPEK